jgi:hypothetical protein
LRENGKNGIGVTKEVDEIDQRRKQGTQREREERGLKTHIDFL